MYLTINMIGNQKSAYSSCKSPYIQIILRLQQKRKIRGKKTCQALLLHTLNAKYNTCQFLKTHYIHQLALAMPWERHHDEALAALTRPTLK